MTLNGRDKELSLYVAGELGPKEERRLKVHLEACRECRQAEQTLRNLNNALRALGEAELPPPLASPFRLNQIEGLHLEGRKDRAGRRLLGARLGPVLSYAAILFVAAAVGVAFVIRSTGSRQNPSAVASRGEVASGSQGLAEQRPLVTPRRAMQPHREVAGGIGATGSPSLHHNRSTLLGPSPQDVSRRQADMVLRLQTDDPTVVVYWQFHD